MAQAKTAIESREVSGFERLKLTDIGQVNLSKGPVESLTIDAEPEILSKIQSTFVGMGQVTEELDARKGGFGNVSFKGTPKITQSINGAGSVSPVE